MNNSNIDTPALDVPILFLVFNRPDVTLKVLAAIRNVKPSRLFIAADGPRLDKPFEKENCNKVLNIIKNGITWNCEVNYLIRETNLGCGLAVSLAINWFFENVEMGIILEDDCVPNNSFFTYSGELLERFKNDDRVMMISGYNGTNQTFQPYSYTFLVGGHIWGWASWRRAWKLFDLKMLEYPRFEKLVLDSNNHETILRKENLYKLAYEGKIDTWDIQWNFAIEINNGLCIWPHTNMVENKGFSESATHTKFKYSWEFKVKSSNMIFPLVHPPLYLSDESVRNQYYKMKKMDHRSYWGKMKSYIYAVAEKLFK